MEDMLFVTVIGLAFVAMVMLYLVARTKESSASLRLDSAMRAGGGGLIVPGTELGADLSQSWFRRLFVPAMGRLGGAW